MSKNTVVLICLLILLLSTCRQALEPKTKRATEVSETAALSTIFPVSSAFSPEHADSSLVASFSGASLRPNGELLIADLSEGNVKWYLPNGTLKVIIGRKGKGPGELVNPAFPRFLGDSVLVLDLGSANKVSIFAPDGRYVRSFNIRNIYSIRGIETLPNGDYVVTGKAPVEDRDQSVLFRLSSDGRIKQKYLARGDVLPTGMTESRVWNT